MQAPLKLLLLNELYKHRAFGFKYTHFEKKLEAQSFNSFKNIEHLKQSIWQCNLCTLSKSKKNSVFGEGNLNAKLLFVGEAPGSTEDECGRPFTGRAGELLTKIIENVLHLKREDVYLANILKCRPPKNRTPSLEEAKMCKPFLFEQIKLIKPKIIVALGATSYQHLTNDFESKISRIRGSEIPFGDAILVPTYHPSFLLRNPSAKKDVYYDMLKVKSIYEKI
ncbi:MAG: uracil-DNA glycosylase [Campylobacteraceae bacterium]|nr:uracil-DNA glycosylase [Campylobacteraceae bacterium]